MKLKTLRGLTKILAQQHKENEFVSGTSANIYTQFYHLLLDSSLDKNAIVEKLYPDPTKRNQYRTLKIRFKDKLINQLLSTKKLQKTEISYLKKIRIEMYLKYALVKILFEHNHRSILIGLLENDLEKYLEFGPIEINMEFLFMLKEHYGLFSSQKKFYHYKVLLQNYSKIEHLHKKIYNIYLELSAYIIHSKDYKNFSNELNIYSCELNNTIKDVDIELPYETNYYLFNSLYLVSLIKGDLVGQLKAIDKALIYFDSKIHLSIGGVYTFTQKKGLTFMTLKRHHEALKCFQSCLEIIPTKRKISWHNCQHYHFHVHILLDDYDTAHKLLNDIMSHRAFKELSDSMKEPWYLKEAYMQFLLHCDVIPLETTESVKMRTFRLSRFLNEVTNYSKDKKGFNIAIVIIQMLFLIIDKKYDAVIDKMASLRQYNYTNVKGESRLRSRTFIKMLLTIPECDFNRNKVMKKSVKLEDTLRQNPQQHSEYSLSIEIIPYEKLWDCLLNHLD